MLIVDNLNILMPVFEVEVSRIMNSTMQICDIVCRKCVMQSRVVVEAGTSETKNETETWVAETKTETEAI